MLLDGAMQIVGGTGESIKSHRNDERVWNGFRFLELVCSQRARDDGPSLSG
jgi:hypothetical protein